MSCPTYAVPCRITLDADGLEDPQLSCCSSGVKPQRTGKPPRSFGWVGEFSEQQVVPRLTVSESLSFGPSCKPLFGSCPPAIFPVRAAATTEETVDSLVSTVNQILQRLRACGILADALQTHSKAHFLQRQVPAATPCSHPTVTKKTLATITDDAAVVALVAQWDQLGLPPAIEESTFTRFYVQMHQQLPSP